MSDKPLLKREVLGRTSGAYDLRDDIRFFDRFCLIGLVVSLISFASVWIGISIGNDQARHETLMGSEPVIVETDTCGISDPLACVTEAVASVKDLFRNAPASVVTVTPSRAVICADAERAYWACAQDADCPTETFEAIADDVNFCQSPPRR